MGVFAPIIADHNIANHQENTRPEEVCVQPGEWDGMREVGRSKSRGNDGVYVGLASLLRGFCYR